MSVKEIIETMRKSLNELKWKNKMEGAMKETLVFQYASRTFGFVAKNQETGKTEIQLRILLNQEIASGADIQKLTGKWNATVGSDEHAGPETAWHAASLAFSGTPAGNGKAFVHIRYIIGEDESGAIAELKEPETVKGICDFLVAYADAVKLVDEFSQEG